MDKLFKCIPFEHPDGYYFDSKESVLYIFEHFEFDCSPSSNYGSKLRRNESIVLKKENNEIKHVTYLIYLQNRDMYFLATRTSA